MTFITWPSRDGLDWAVHVRARTGIRTSSVARSSMMGISWMIVYHNLISDVESSLPRFNPYSHVISSTSLEVFIVTWSSCDHDHMIHRLSCDITVKVKLYVQLRKMYYLESWKNLSYEIFISSEPEEEKIKIRFDYRYAGIKYILNTLSRNTNATQ